MLHAITWQQFMSAVMLLAVGYYVITTLRFYGKKLVIRFKSGTQGSVAPAATARGATPTVDLIGTIKEDAPVNAGQTALAVDPDDDLPMEDEPAAPITPVEESISQVPNDLGTPVHTTATGQQLWVQSACVLVAELTVLWEEVSTQDITRQATGDLGKALLARYAHLATSPYRPLINQFIVALGKTQAFQVSDAEVNTWW